jgi:hypothetical protein
MKTPPPLPAKNNFADLRELADKLLSSSADKDLKRMAAIVGTLLYRCDLLERQVERLGTCVCAPSAPSAAKKRKR